MPAYTDRISHPAISSASSSARLMDCTVCSILTTTPFRSPVDGLVPIPTISIPPFSEGRPPPHKSWWCQYQGRLSIQIWTCATPWRVSQCMSGYCVIPITRNQTRIHHFGRRCGVTLLITAVLSQNKGVFFRPVSQSEYPGYSIFSVKSLEKTATRS